MLTRIRKFSEEREQGFTLIELLVVIIIIGILAAIAIPVFLNQRKKGVDAGLKSDLKNAATAVESWATANPSSAVAADSVNFAGATMTAGTGALAEFKATKGNVVKVKPGSETGSYTLCAYNAGATTANVVTAGLAYDSAAGGLTGGTVDCS